MGKGQLNLSDNLWKEKTRKVFQMPDFILTQYTE